MLHFLIFLSEISHAHFSLARLRASALSKSLVLDIRPQPIETAPLYPSDRALPLQIAGTVITFDGFSALAHAQADVACATESDLDWRFVCISARPCQCSAGLVRGDRGPLGCDSPLMHFPCRFCPVGGRDCSERRKSTRVVLSSHAFS